MLIGLTYDLRADYLAAGYSAEETAEFDGIVTIDAINEALVQCGHQTDRIGNGRQLVERLAADDRWDLVFNIAEGLHGAAREAQVPAILDLYEIPYTFSDPLVMALCLHKGLTKTAVAHAGVPTTPFALVESIEDVESVDLPYPLFAKPVAEGTGKGVSAESKITGREALRLVCGRLLALCRQPVLVETFLPGREFTVGILGTGGESRVIGSMEITLLPAAEAEVYSYNNKSRWEEFCRYVPRRAADDAEVAQAERVALAAHRAGLPRRLPRRYPLRRPGPAAFHGNQPCGRFAPQGFRSADDLQFLRRELSGADRADCGRGLPEITVSLCDTRKLRG